MPREVITVHVGQCGNQLGTRFWQLALGEHAALHRHRQSRAQSGAGARARRASRPFWRAALLARRLALCAFLAALAAYFWSLASVACGAPAAGGRSG